MSDLLTRLMKRNQIDFVVGVFLNLDLNSLETCDTVSSSWRSFIRFYIFSSSKHLKMLLEQAWLKTNPEFEVLRFDGSVRSISCDQESSSFVVGLINHKERRCKMIIIQGENIKQIPENPDDDNFTCTGVKIDQNKNVIVVTKSGTKAMNENTNDHRIDLDIVEVINKTNLKTIYRKVVENSPTWIHANATENNIIIRDGYSLTYLKQYDDCDNVLPEMQINLNSSYYNKSLHFHEQFVIIGCGKCVTLLNSETRDEVVVTIEEEVRDIVVSWPYLLIISDFKIFVIKYSNSGNKNENEALRTRMKAKLPHKLVPGLSVRNNVVLAVYDVRDKCHIFIMSDILKDSAEVVSPIHSFSVPSFSDGCITTVYPILCLTPTSLLVSYPEADRVDKFCVWKTKFKFPK